jgi:hypothetical protein
MSTNTQNQKNSFSISWISLGISVLAIVMAILLPMLTGITKRSTLDADKQIVSEMNEVLASMEDEDGVIEFEEVLAALDEAGFSVKNTNGWTPASKGYEAYWWCKWGRNRIYLVDVETGKPVYPNPGEFFDKNDAKHAFSLKAGN